MPRLGPINGSANDRQQFRTSSLHPGQAFIEDLTGGSSRHIIYAIKKRCSPLPFLSPKGSLPLAAEIVAKVVVDHARQPRHLRVIRFALASALELNTLPRFLIKAAAEVEEPDAVSMKA